MTRIGFIGLGRMGMPMAANLLKAGYPVIGYDTDARRTAAFAKLGAQCGTGSAEVAQASDIVISMIMNDVILHRVALGPDGVIENMAAGAVFSDLSTVTPAASAVVRKAAADRNHGYLSGAVAGSVGPATEGSLALFASGSSADFERCLPAFQAMASSVHYVGQGEQAAYLKLVHSQIVGTYSAMIGEALAFGEKGGLNITQIVDILEAGPLGSRQLSLKAPILKSRRFDDPPSDIDTAAKDVDMVLDTARKDAMPLPVLSCVRQIMATAQARGGGKRDIYSILETVEDMGQV